MSNRHEFYDMDLIYDWGDKPLLAKILDVLSGILLVIALIEVVVGCIMLYAIYVSCYTFDLMK